MKVANSPEIREVAEYFSFRRQISSRLNQILIPDMRGCMGDVSFPDEDALLKAVDAMEMYLPPEFRVLNRDELIIATVANSIAVDVDGRCLPPELLVELGKAGRIFHGNELEQNPYYSAVFVPKKKLGRYEYETHHLAKYEITGGAAPVYKEGISFPSIFMIDHDFPHPALTDGEKTWMSIAPSEIVSMEKPIENASGDVLVLGCGLGYFPYMIARKPEVKRIVVVEKTPYIIDLFNENLLPQFKNEYKIEVVCADAFDYLSNLNDGDFDYCFADIWDGGNDILPYLRVRDLCQKLPSMNIDYWIEVALLANIIIPMAYSLFMTKHYKNIGRKVPSRGMKMPREYRRAMEWTEKLLSDIEINTPEDVLYFLNPENLIDKAWRSRSF